MVNEYRFHFRSSLLPYGRTCINDMHNTLCLPFCFQTVCTFICHYSHLLAWPLVHKQLKNKLTMIRKTCHSHKRFSFCRHLTNTAIFPTRISKRTHSSRSNTLFVVCFQKSSRLNISVSENSSAPRAVSSVQFFNSNKIQRLVCHR